MVAVLCVLQWAWPNVVHEPLHMVALYAQGGEGYINFDWSFPAHPSTTRTTDLSGPVGALLFYLLPSIVSAVLLIGLWFSRKWHEVVTVWSHFVLPTYLGFDLIINIRGFQNPISDFRVLTLLPTWTMWALIVMVMCGTMAIIMSAQCTVKESCMQEVFE